ncbi:MAG: nicotinate-nucleotide adenylyltransferase [Candidatus Aminicenantales bacterium]
MKRGSIRRLGLFGGTFNPIHNGHLKVASEVSGFFSLDRVLFIPSRLPPHKPAWEVVSGEDRLRMVELAIKGYPQFEASSIEVERPGPSYSILTIKKIKQEYLVAEIFFLLGIDAFLEIKTWKDYDQVLRSCSFIVVSRPGFTLNQATAILGDEWKDRVIEVKKTSSIHQPSKAGILIFLFPMASLDISSSEIRRRLHEQEPVSGMLPEAVEKYIHQNKLYRDIP